MAELLTPSIAYAYNEKAKALPYNGMQDIGERRRLRQDLQERCGITENETKEILHYQTGNRNRVYEKSNIRAALYHA